MYNPCVASISAFFVATDLFLW